MMTEVNCRDQDNTAMNIIIMHVIFEQHKKEISHWKNIDLIKIDLKTFFWLNEVEFLD